MIEYRYWRSGLPHLNPVVAQSQIVAQPRRARKTLSESLKTLRRLSLGMDETTFALSFECRGRFLSRKLGC
jgi:hypothetical protein